MRDTQDSLRVLAEETGGFAVVNQNDFDKALKRIDAETSDYYVLGYYSTNPDPLRRTRKLEVKTTRPRSECVVTWRVHAATDRHPRISDRPAARSIARLLITSWTGAPQLRAAVASSRKPGSPR